MHPTRRLEYLQALGIDAWVRKDALAPETAPAEAAGAAVSWQADRQLDEASVAHVGQAHEPARPLPGRIDPPPPGAAAQGGSAPARAAQAASGSRAGAAVPVSEISFAHASRAIPADAEAQWAALEAEVLSCTRCPLHATRTQGVFGVGDRRAEWLIIGEAPGKEEDRRGEPFVGRAGQLLNAMLKAIGLAREQVFIANVLKSRPPNNRDPKPDEVGACLPYLMRQIALLQPRLMVAVGRIAAQNLLATDMALGRLRGRIHYFGELNTPLIVTYHPAYLLRSPADKAKAWEDLKFARSTFQRLASQEA